MERYRHYVRGRALAMAGQQSAYEEGLAADAALRAARDSMAAPVPREGLTATPATAWDLVHHRGMSVREVAVKLGVRPPTVLELLADYRTVAEEHELRMLKASDAAHVYGGRSPW